MKNIKSLALLIVTLVVACQSPQERTPFEQYFSNASLRIDYFHTGDATQEKVAIDQLYQYEGWAGSLSRLIDRLDYGAYYYKLYDAETDTLLYAKGFDSYFKEYQTSRPAMEGKVKQFHETALVPMPQEKVVFVLEKRATNGGMEEVFRQVIDPKIAQQADIDPEIRIYTSQDSGHPNIKADIAIIGEGYTAAEAQKFEEDLQRFTEVFFRAEPCRSNRTSFNIRGVLRPSPDSGIDEPRAGIDKNTAVSATFNSMGSERYVLTEDNRALRDIAGHVPYDALYIMVNHSRYGGGGIYNFYCVYTSDNIDSDYLMVHEFGHSFFGLADEYYTSSTSYNDFYSPDYEPNEPNITALKDPENVKWKHLLSDSIEVPTPWRKARYDSIDLAWQQRRTDMNNNIAALQKNGAPADSIEAAKADYDRKSAERNAAVQAYLEGSPFAGKVGAFEGAGYASTGLYRSSVNCIMFTRTNYFCPVCQEAMRKVIDSYTE